MAYRLKMKRVYEPAAEDDGYRVLVDRLWPRGMTKERAHLGAWVKQLAPSPELRTWFGHKPERYEEFSVRYRVELDSNDAVAVFTEECAKRLEQGPVTLVYAAREGLPNHVTVLKSWLEERLTTR